jgi:glycosyltransferase involved in cell wall biosynthesis
MTLSVRFRTSPPPTVIHYTDASEFGGAEQMILTLMGALRSYGWRSVLVYHGGHGISPLIDGAAALGIETRVVPSMRDERRWLQALRLSRDLRYHGPALFHAHLSSPTACRHALIAAALAGMSVIATVQLFLPISGRRAIYRQRLLSLGIHRYIAVSNDVARRMRPLCVNPGGKIRVVRNGVPIDEFDGNLAAGSQVGSTRTVLAVARLHPQKGLIYLLDAATLVPDARFVVAGDGPARTELEAQARRLGLGERFRFLGHRHDIPELLRSAGVFVLPSLFEGLPVSVLEAMAAGTPVVATDVAGTDEAVVHGESGILVPPRDPAALAGAIREVISNTALARRLVAGGKARVRQSFSADAVARGVCQVYEDVFSRQVTGTPQCSRALG